MSQLTTHILDTTKGKPAKMVHIVLYQLVVNDWVEISSGITNSDGRVPNLLPNDDLLPLSTYKLKFETRAYFDAMDIKSFYPFVEIIFEISTGDHYHVPLLLNPYGYSTYRGS